MSLTSSKDRNVLSTSDRSKSWALRVKGGIGHRAEPAGAGEEVPDRGAHKEVPARGAHKEVDGSAHKEVDGSAVEKATCTVGSRS